jgi:hypothetical protein
MDVTITLTRAEADDLCYQLIFTAIDAPLGKAIRKQLFGEGPQWLRLNGNDLLTVEPVVESRRALAAEGEARP